MKKVLSEVEARKHLVMAGIRLREQALLYEVGLIYKEVYKEGLKDHGYDEIELICDDESDPRVNVKVSNPIVLKLKEVSRKEATVGIVESMIACGGSDFIETVMMDGLSHNGLNKMSDLELAIEYEELFDFELEDGGFYAAKIVN